MGTLPAKKQETGNPGKAPGRGRGGKRSTSWKPGQSGNPKGRPSAGMSWAELIIEQGNKQLPGSSELTYKQAVVLAAYQHAVKGDPRFFLALMQRSEPQADELRISHDWREAARALGLSEDEVLAEAEAILKENESSHPDGD